MKPKFAKELEEHLSKLLAKRFLDLKVNVFQIYGPHNMEEMDGFGIDIVSDSFKNSWVTQLTPLHQYLLDNGFEGKTITILPVSSDEFYGDENRPEWDGP